MADLISSVALRILQVDFTRIGSWWRYADLSAPYWRFYWNDSPGASIVHDGRRLALDPRNVYLIAPDSSFASFPPRSGGKPGHFYVHFTVEGDSFTLPESIFLFNVSEAVIGRIKEIIRFRECGEGLKAEMGAISVVGGFMALLPFRISAKSGGGRFSKAVEILKNHCERGISNPELAAKFSMSTNSFLRFFSRSAGTSPQKYLRRLRVERACFMLHCTEKSIKEIADSLGFCDRYHFTKVFSELRGESPGSFRRKVYAKGRL